MTIVHFLTLHPEGWRRVADRLEVAGADSQLVSSLRWHTNQAIALRQLTIGVTTAEAVLIKTAAEQLGEELQA